LFASVSLVRPLSTGDLMVRDLVGRKVVLLDSALRMKRLVADTTSATSGAYTSRFAGFIRYRGDSSLFIDSEALTMSVVDERGEHRRVMAIPRPQDASLMVGGPLGTPGVDAGDRIVYRSFPRSVPRSASSGPLEPGQRRELPVMPDSAPVLRVDMHSRALDTLAWVRIPVTRMEASTTDRGYRVTARTNPMPIVDDWAVLPDGRVAVLRGRDYHVDWFASDGSSRTTPKIPFAWERLSDDDKTRMRDSVNAQYEAERERRMRASDGGIRAGVAEGGAASRAAPPVFQAPDFQSVDVKEFPDYRPAFRAGAMSADNEGRLWIRTTTTSDSGPIYDVVDQNGRLVDRVKLPFGRVISGFGRGVVYMGVLDDHGARLERARYR
jgi:hypothetical protein